MGCGMTEPILTALLRHLEQAGFEGSPRVPGDGSDETGRAGLSWIDGRIAYPDEWSDEGIWQVGRMLRALHEATAGFVPPPGTSWPGYWLRQTGPDSVIGHCDAGPWNTVARDGLPVAFVGWDVAGPVDLLDDIASCAWWQAQLRADRPDAPALPDAATRARKLACFAEGYGLAADLRAALVGRMIEFAIRECADEAEQAQISPASTDPAPMWGLAWRARAAAWMIEHRGVLERAVRP